MDIVRMIKRKYGEVENHIDSQIISNNHYYHKNIHKEEYIHTVCHNMSYWFISNLGLHTYDDFFKLVETCKPIMIRLFRTKLSINYEKLNWMKNAFNIMVDSLCEDCLVHSHVKDLWVIDSKTKQWIISFHPPQKYLWWNYDFFENIYKYLSMDINNRQPIIDWIQTKMNHEIKFCEPDKLPGKYDWSSDFYVDYIVSKGEPLTEINEIINIINSRIENVTYDTKTC